MWLTNSSVGRKLVMSVTGAALILFLTFHALMNAVAIFWPAAYNVVCAFLGANWYALVASMGLAVLFIIHILYALWLTVENRRARGGDRYAVNRKPAGVEWSSRNMLVLGFVVLAFLGLHLVQFWAKMQWAEIRHTFGIVDGVAVPPAAGTAFLQYTFQNIWVVIVYAIAFVALWFHMTHGFWSMFHTAGWDNDIWIKRLKCIGNWWATIVVGLFLAEAVVFTCMAKCPECNYLNNPALQEQYVEFTEEFIGEYPEAVENVCPEAQCLLQVCEIDLEGCPMDEAPCPEDACEDACPDGPCADAPCQGEAACGNNACQAPCPNHPDCPGQK